MDKSSPKKCVYCLGTTGKKLSKEHLVSQCVREVLFDDPTTFNITKDVAYKGHPTIKDVCEGCNSGLVPIDGAGAELVKRVLSTRTPPDHLNITELEFCWLVKTHLNFIRAASSVSGKPVLIPNKFYQSLLKGHVPEGLRYELHFIAYDAPEILDLSWKEVNVVVDHDHFVSSGLRLWWLETFLTIPKDSASEQIPVFENEFWRTLKCVTFPAPAAYQLFSDLGPGFCWVRASASNVDNLHDYYRKHNVPFL